MKRNTQLRVLSYEEIDKQSRENEILYSHGLSVWVLKKTNTCFHVIGNLSNFSTKMATGERFSLGRLDGKVALITGLF